MILTIPLRLMTLHLSQIGFTEALTFISYSFREWCCVSALPKKNTHPSDTLLPCLSSVNSFSDNSDPQDLLPSLSEITPSFEMRRYGLRQDN